MNIQNIIAQMTLDEKCSLLSGADFWHTKAVERLGIKPCMVSDGPHGLRKQDDKADHLGVNESIKAVCLPAACAVAASFDPSVARALGEAVGDACQHEQLSVILGPAVNIKRSPLCGRNFEYYSEDPLVAAELGTAQIEGVQSRNVGTSVKHYAANNQEHRRMSSNSEVDERTMREIYLPAFESAVKKGKAWTVMCSYNKINGVFASENKEYLTDILRDEWGFDGCVVSDWGAVSDRVKGVEAGLDLEMPASGGINDRRVAEAVRAGKLDEKYVDAAVAHILTLNQRYLDNAKPETPWDMEAQHALARKLAAECMVLLKNDDHVLPLHEGDAVAVIGEFAAVPRYQGGGSSHINSFKVTSLMDALEGVPGITYAKGYDVKDSEPNEALIAEAVKAAKAAKVAVIVAGLPDSYESEGYDRTHLQMPPCQNALIEQVAAANPNTVVVLYNGSPVVMPWVNHVKGIIEGYLGGQAVGGATKDVLFGTVNPSGHLPETFPLRLEDTPCYLTYGGEGNTAVYNEGIFVGYRYYDKRQMEVLFPFGHGLSYTTFEYSDLKLSADTIRDTDTLTVTVKVKNTGKCAGKEVVQLYVGDEESTVFRPVRELKGFKKIALEPGEEKTVSFTLCKRAFAYWHVQLHDWHVESGKFRISVGRSSRELPLCAEVTVESTVPVPVHFDENSIVMDIMADPHGRAVLTPMIEEAGKRMMGGDVGDAGAAAISQEMQEAMMKYMPLRSMLGFGGGSVTPEQLDALIAALNRR